MPSISLDGLDVCLYRGKDGRIVVDIGTGGLAEKDEHPEGIPNIRILVNEQEITIEPDGSVTAEE